MLGLSNRVSLVGALSEEALSATYPGVDMLISASFYEGYGMAPVEGLARGLPIVAAAAGAVTDTVLPAAGLLVPRTTTRRRAWRSVMCSASWTCANGCMKERSRLGRSCHAGWTSRPRSSRR